MRTFRRWGALPLAILFTSGLDSPAGAQAPTPDSTSLALAAQVLTVTHAIDQALTSMEAMIAAQRQLNSKLPPVFWDRFEARIHADAGQLADMVAVIYATRFTADELRGLLAFYKTPLGRRLLEEQPLVVQESIQAGQRWGAAIGAQIGQELAAEGAQTNQ